MNLLLNQIILECMMRYSSQAISILMPSYEWFVWVLFAIVTIGISGSLMYTNLISPFGIIWK